MAILPICSVNGCDKTAQRGRRGYCGAHYKRWYRYGDPKIRRKITNGEAQRFYREVVLSYDENDCLVWPYAKYPSGYGHMVYEGRDCTVSRLVCEEEHGPPPTPEHEAAHSCGNGSGGCVAKRHLVWKTHIGNEADKIGHGTAARGERHGNAKLTEADVRKIRALKGKLYQCEIAEMFGVSSHLIGLIHRRERWAWLE